MAFNAEEIRKKNWKQGDLFSTSSSQELLGQVYPGKEARLILASQDCDILHKGNGEPFVDVFLLVPINKLSATNMKARNARRLHLDFSMGSKNVRAGIEFWSRRSIPRDLLNEHDPAKDAALTQSCLKWFREWLGKRYDRVAWPDAFNDRLTAHNAEERIREILAPAQDCLQNLYLAIEPENEELNETLPYVIRVAMIMPDALSGRQDMVKQAQTCQQQLADFLRVCEGIEVESIELMTDKDFTLADLDTYRPWDFTDLSLTDSA